MGPPLKDDDEEVLERIMADGTFDSLRHQLLDELRNDVRRLDIINAVSGLRRPQSRCGVAGSLGAAHRCEALDPDHDNCHSSGRTHDMQYWITAAPACAVSMGSDSGLPQYQSKGCVNLQAELQRSVKECIRRSNRLREAAFEGADEKQLFEELRHDSKLECVNT